MQLKYIYIKNKTKQNKNTIVFYTMNTDSFQDRGGYYSIFSLSSAEIAIC